MEAFLIVTQLTQHFQASHVRQREIKPGNASMLLMWSTYSITTMKLHYIIIA